MTFNHDEADFRIDWSELDRCLLCHDTPCAKACPNHYPIDRIIRSACFLNLASAYTLAREADCTYCNAPCQRACVVSKRSTPVAIQHLISNLHDYGVSLKGINQLDSDAVDRMLDETIQPDITMDICGVRLENPFLLSSSVVGSTYDMCARAFEAGWAGVSFKTICTFPQHETSPRFSTLRCNSNNFYGFKNIEQLSDHSVLENLEIFRQLKRNYPSKVIIASIMGKNEEEWEMLARECQSAGADVIECNFSCPNMEATDLGVTIGQSPELVEKFTRAVRRGTTLPVLAKLTPNVADMVPMALAAKRAGADGIAAINTINSITGVDPFSFTAQPDVHGKSMIGGYSGAAVKPIALRFISDLGRNSDLKGMHISGMGGVQNWFDAVEFIALGAGSIQITTAVMQYGYRIIDDLVDGLKGYLRLMNISSVREIIGAATKTVVDHDQVERDSILLPKFNLDKCIGCGRCYISCRDGGHQAIEFDLETRHPKLNGKKCVGCHLCRLVCNANAIGVAGKRIHQRK